MIAEITSSEEAREFLNSVPFDQYVPDGFPVCNGKTLILGWYEPQLKACFPSVIRNGHLEIHAACLPCFRGAASVNAGKLAIKWVFENTSHTLIVVYPKLRHGSLYAYSCGMRRNGDRFEVKKWADL